MPNEEFRKIVDIILNSPSNLDSAVREANRSTALMQKQTKEFISNIDQAQADGQPIPDNAKLAIYTNYLTAQKSTDTYKGIIDSIIDSKPESGLRFLSRLEDAANQELETLQALRNRYSERVTGEKASKNARDNHFLSSPQVTQEERNDFVVQHIVTEQLLNHYSKQKDLLMMDLLETNRDVLFRDKHLTSAIDAVRSTVAPMAPTKAEEMSDLMRQTLEEFKNDKTAPTPKENGPRSTPAVEGPAAPERGGR